MRMEHRFRARLTLSACRAASCASERGETMSLPQRLPRSGGTRELWSLRIGYNDPPLVTDLLGCPRNHRQSATVHQLHRVPDGRPIEDAEPESFAGQQRFAGEWCGATHTLTIDGAPSIKRLACKMSDFAVWPPRMGRPDRAVGCGCPRTERMSRTWPPRPPDSPANSSLFKPGRDGDHRLLGMFARRPRRRVRVGASRWETSRRCRGRVRCRGDGRRCRTW